MEFQVIDQKKKIVEITFNNETLKFGLKVKRSFTVLIALLERYPEHMNIHDVGGIDYDSNRALSSLRREDGFEHFLNVENRSHVNFVKIDIPVLFEKVSRVSDVINLYPVENRESLSPKLQNSIIERFSGRCNITGIGLKENTEFGSVVFMKHAMSLAFDHRKPLSKGGSNAEHNFQLLSQMANNEKNKICNSCKDPQCEMCALAHPERVRTIHPTGQDISNLRRNGK